MSGYKDYLKEISDKLDDRRWKAEAMFHLEREKAQGLYKTLKSVQMYLWGNVSKKDQDDMIKEVNEAVSKYEGSVYSGQKYVPVVEWKKMVDEEIKKHCSHVNSTSNEEFLDCDQCNPRLSAVKREQAKSESILDEAKRIVEGKRASDYGPVTQSFDRTASIWSGILGVTVTRRQVAMCMVGLKLAREAYSPKRDNRVDAVGYLYLLDELC